MKKIKVLTSLVGLTGLTMGLVPMIAGCSCNPSEQVTIELDESVTKQNVSVKSSNIQKGKESTIVLTIPSGKVLDNVTLTIGNTIITKGSGLSISGNTITIEAEKVTNVKIIITSVTLKDKEEEFEEINQTSFTELYTTYRNGFISRIAQEEYSKVSCNDSDYWYEEGSSTKLSIAKSNIKYYPDNNLAYVAMNYEQVEGYKIFTQVAGTNVAELQGILTLVTALITADGLTPSVQYYKGSDESIQIKVLGTSANTSTVYLNYIISKMGYVTYQYVFKHISIAEEKYLAKSEFHFTYSKE